MDAETRRRAEDSNVEKVTGRTAGNGLPKGRPFFCSDNGDGSDCHTFQRNEKTCRENRPHCTG